jgi:TPP-dependent pyruvate/acetoin dehydrogenase alpha subunit
MTGEPDEPWAWQALEKMLLIRRFEEGVLKLSTEGHFLGHYHLYIGQEATGVAAMSAVRDGDHLTTTHRNHGHVLARGVAPGPAFAEILGRGTGLNGGRGGTIHLCDAALGFLSTSGIVGGAISLAVGGAYACKQRGGGSMTMAFFGDGALEEGVSYEALNIAALWKLPIVFMCENNSAGSWAPGAGYPTLVHAGSNLGDIPRSLGITTEQIDGADLHGVRDRVAAAVERCRHGEGPVFIEAMTRRWPGSNPLWPELATGITDIGVATGEVAIEGEHADWIRGHDPILRMARDLTGEGTRQVERLKETDASVTASISAALEFAIESALPDPATAFDNVYA